MELSEENKPKIEGVIKEIEDYNGFSKDEVIEIIDDLILEQKNLGDEFLNELLQLLKASFSFGIEGMQLIPLFPDLSQVNLVRF